MSARPEKVLESASAPNAKAGLGGMLKNASASLIGNLLSVPLQFVGFIMVARSLGPVIFGQYAFAQELTLFVVYVADAGLNVIATKEMARHKEDAGKIHGTLLKLKLYLSLACYIGILAIGAPLIQGEGTFAALAALAAANLFLSYIFLANGIFRAFERMIWESVTGLLQPVCFCLFTALVAYSSLVPGGLVPMALARLASYLPVVAIALYITWRLAPPRRSVTVGHSVEYLRQGFPIVLAMFAFDALLRMSVLFLQAWSTPQQLSMFTVSSRIVYSLWLIPYIFSGAWLPGMARSFLEQRQGVFGSQALRLTRLLLIVASPLAVGLYMTAEQAILLLFGPEYKEGIPALRVLAFCLPFLFLFYGMKTILEAQNRQREFYRIVTAGLIAGLSANALLIPRGGAVGASWAYFTGLGVSTGLGYALVGRVFPRRGILLSLLRVALGCGATALGFLLLQPTHLVLGICAAALAYTGVLFLLGEINSKTLL